MSRSAEKAAAAAAATAAGPIVVKKSSSRSRATSAAAAATAPVTVLDPIDHELLGLLQENCRLSYAELGEKVGLSISAVNERLKKLQTQGVIQRYVALVDPAAVGLTVCAFVEVAIERPKRLAELWDVLKKRPEVVECHHTAGEFPVWLKIRVADTTALEEFLGKHIRAHRGVTRTRVTVVLSSAKQATALAMPKAPATASQSRKKDKNKEKDKDKQAEPGS